MRADASAPMAARTPSRLVLVTGATAGLGRALVVALLARGHRVVATGRDPHALAALGTALGHVGTPAAPAALTTVPLDVTDAASIAAARDATVAAVGVPDVLVNNAGYAHMAPTADLAAAALRAQFETNVLGALAVTQAFLPGMLARGAAAGAAGRVVNVSSLAGRLTLPWGGAYHASKYALEALSDALRLELAPFGVEVVRTWKFATTKL